MGGAAERWVSVQRDLAGPVGRDSLLGVLLLESGGGSEQDKRGCSAAHHHGTLEDRSVDEHADYM